jgi:hypothetical protein
LYGVEGYANELLITINKNDPSIVVEVLRPGANTPISSSNNDQGDTVEHTSSGLSEGYHIKHDPGSDAAWAGCWTIRMSAPAPALPDARVDFIPITSGDYVLKFNKPSLSVWPVGKPMPLAVGVYSNTQQLVNTSAVTLDPSMSLVITGPVQPQTVNLAAKGAVYEGQYKGNTVEGTYTLAASISSTQMHPPSSATANCPNTNVQAGKLTRTLPLDVRLIPWVDLVEPSPDSDTPGGDFQVRARVMTGTEVLKPAAGDTVQVDVEVDKGDGSQSKSFRLRSDPNNPAEFSGKPAAGTVLDSGTYTLTAVLLSKVGGKSTTDTTQVRITLRQPLPTATVSAPEPTPTPTPPCCTPQPEFPWSLVLGVVAVSGVLGLGFMLWRMVRNTAKMDGVALTTFTGDSIPLSGTKQVKDLSGASVRFTASPTSGNPSMQVVSTTTDPVLLNGMEQMPGSSASSLSEGDIIQVGNESYTVGGRPKSARRPKKGRGNTQPDEFGLGDPNYGNIDNLGDYDDSKN